MIAMQIVQLNPVATAPTSVAPKRVNAKIRFAVAQPAAVASNNVNDLITVTKQMITSKWKQHENVHSLRIDCETSR